MLSIPAKGDDRISLLQCWKYLGTEPLRKMKDGCANSACLESSNLCPTKTYPLKETIR